MTIPTYVPLVYCAGFACAPLALFVPPPYRLAVRASRLCRVLLVLAALMIAAGAAIMALGPWWEGFSLGGVAFLMLMVMFWAAAPREHPDEDDESSGGGGGGLKRPPGPDDPDAPDGLAIDWAEFDRQRDSWQHELV